jgi:hypothetical protein
MTENDSVRDIAKEMAEAMHAIREPTGLAIFPKIIIRKADAKGAVTRYGIRELGFILLAY